MDQKEIEEKLKNFQVKHIEKPEKKEEQPLSDHEGFCEQWKHAAKILIGIGGEWKNPNGKISVRRMTSWQNVWRAEIILS